MIIERPVELERIAGTKKWVLVFGRRKTGKTFLAENFAKFDDYFFVKNDKTIISKSGDKTISYETFLEILKRDLEEKKTVVVDEFHRLGKDFFDFLHYTKKDGKLILLSSTLFLAKKIFSSQSALLGFFAEAKIGLISLKDSIKAVKKSVSEKQQLLELAILLREPIAIGYFEEKETARKTVAKIIVSSTKTIPALTGEIFAEEERNLSSIYEGIIRAIAAGKIVSSEISSQLFAKKLIKKDDPSIVQQYLSNLYEFGIIKKIEVFGKKRFVYKLVSPLARIFYYADEKYNISERNPTEKEIEAIVDEIMPKIIEDSIREYLAEKFGLKETIIEAKDFDIDACLVKFKKIEIAAEIKWKKKTSKEDIEKAEKNLQKTGAAKKMLFVTDKTSAKSEKLEIIDVSDL